MNMELLDRLRMQQNRLVIVFAATVVLLVVMAAFSVPVAPADWVGVLWIGIFALTALVMGFIFLRQVFRIRRDLAEGLITERCRLVAVRIIPKTRMYAWEVESAAGKLRLTNQSGVDGRGLVGRTLRLTFARNARLLFQVEMEDPSC